MNFAIIGMGYVAEKHLRAIKEVGGNLVAALDPYDSVGILDSYFPDCRYFNEFEVFDRHCSRSKIDYVSICSPNYLHEAHCRFAMRIGADAICEKPLVLRERNLDQLLKVESQTEKRVWNILQLRLSDVFNDMVVFVGSNDVHDVRVRYVAPRGAWYDHSWKMDIGKSGGTGTNIGVHLIDLISCLFGKWNDVEVLSRSERWVSFIVRFNSVAVKVDLSTKGKAERVIVMNRKEFNLTPKINNLHTKSYEKIIAGEGFGIESARYAIQICEELREK